MSCQHSFSSVLEEACSQQRREVIDYEGQKFKHVAVERCESLGIKIPKHLVIPYPQSAKMILLLAEYTHCAARVFEPQDHCGHLSGEGR